jgi:hypothetical protein
LLHKNEHRVYGDLLIAVGVQNVEDESFLSLLVVDPPFDIVAVLVKLEIGARRIQEFPKSVDHNFANSLLRLPFFIGPVAWILLNEFLAEP